MGCTINTATLKLFAFFCILSLAYPIYGKHTGVQKVTFGRMEEILAFEEKIQFKAKLDTGAKTSSLSATNIQEFELDGQVWVAFQVTDPQTKKIIDKKIPLERHVYIKQHNKTNKVAKTTKRPVILLPICLGAQHKIIEVNLVDRSNFNCPVLLGRDAIIKFKGVIDPSEQFISVPTCKVMS